MTKSNYTSKSKSTEWLTVREVAEMLRIPLTRAYMLIQSGELPAVRLGERSIRVNRQELEEFLTQERRVVNDSPGADAYPPRQ